MDWKRSQFLKAVYSSLDLCLACKGCSAECPSGVDMPRLKYEFLNEYYKHHVRPLRDYIFGYFHLIARWVQPIAPWVNWLAGNSWVRKSIARSLSLSSERPFPEFSHGRATAPQMDNGGKLVLLLVDVFSRYVEPQVEQAALDLLHWSGHEVRVLPVIGAGASLLSKGFIEGARSHAERVLAAIDTLGGTAEYDIVGCEPPEMYCLKHEYLPLLPDRSPVLEKLRHRVWLLDEFLLRSEVFGRFISQIESSNGRIIQDRTPLTFHPHCHQRAEGLAEDGRPLGVSATVDLLKRFGFDVSVMDAGCCGMAGTFGYEAEHYELSMQVGELGVLPAARMADILVSTGSVCRMQIRHGAIKDVSHPIVVVRDRVGIFLDHARSRVT
jgi:Fe-S oxidoreductase